MEFIASIVDLFIHLDQHLLQLSAQYGAYLYLLLFLVIFAETGLVIAPYLPGDSLLFAAGALCSLGAMDVWLLLVLLCIAAIAGDSVNYTIGSRFGQKLFTSKTSKLFNQEHLNKAHVFYEKHGGKTIILARFVPIVRTFAPFVAGIGTMSYRHFFLYNVVGGFVWVSLFLLAGYWFGNHPFIKKHFGMVLVGVVLISIIPIITELISARRQKPKKT